MRHCNFVVVGVACGWVSGGVGWMARVAGRLSGPGSLLAWL